MPRTVRIRLMAAFISLLSAFGVLPVATVAAETPAVRIAQLRIYPEHLEAFTAAVREEMRDALRLEPGVLAIYAVADKEDPTRITFFEMYASDDAYEQHRNTPHFLKYFETTKTMIAERVLIEGVPVEMQDRGPSKPSEGPNEF